MGPFWDNTYRYCSHEIFDTTGATLRSQQNGSVELKSTDDCFDFGALSKQVPPEEREARVAEAVHGLTMLSASIPQLKGGGTERITPCQWLLA